MKMDQMNEYFEERGFEVERVYLKNENEHRFTIKKEGHILIEYFKYPHASPAYVGNAAQKSFVENMTRRFYAMYGCGIEYVENTGTQYIDTGVYLNYSKMYTPNVNSTTIKDVIFNEPATIVFWADGTKTVVKCQEGDEFDPEKGLAMAIAKKVYGNKGHYFETVKKWCGPYHKKRANIQPWMDAIRDAIEKLKDRDI